MTKPELVDLLKELNVPVNEGTPADKIVEDPEIIYFWDYYWEDLVASGKDYNTTVTYQISFLAEVPRSPKLLELKHKLNNIGLHPSIQHEYDSETRRWHSYFALEVLENI